METELSYIVAFVDLDEHTKPIPVECYRTDLIVGDQVVVSVDDGSLRRAIVVELQNLNWSCRHRIECKASEATETSKGQILLPGESPVRVGICTEESFISAAQAIGCIPVKPSHRTYRLILLAENAKIRARIFLRKNGIDLQLVDKDPNGLPEPYSIVNSSLSEGQSVRHYYSHTKFNLFEGILRFCRSVMNDEPDLSRYFIAVGSNDKRPEEFKL